jgi:hypothetical protein
LEGGIRITQFILLVGGVGFEGRYIGVDDHVREGSFFTDDPRYGIDSRLLERFCHDVLL